MVRLQRMVDYGKANGEGNAMKRRREGDARNGEGGNEGGKSWQRYVVIVMSGLLFYNEFSHRLPTSRRRVICEETRWEGRYRTRLIDSLNAEACMHAYCYSYSSEGASRNATE